MNASSASLLHPASQAELLLRGALVIFLMAGCFLGGTLATGVLPAGSGTGAEALAGNLIATVPLLPVLTAVVIQLLP